MQQRRLDECLIHEGTLTAHLQGCPAYKVPKEPQYTLGSRLLWEGGGLAVFEHESRWPVNAHLAVPQ
jgi:hypothetical protein